VLFCIFSRAYGFPEKLKKIPIKAPDVPYKEEADVFEAAVGGLYLDGITKEGGWIVLQQWFDTLIEPWIDWIMARLDEATRDAFTTFNHVPLSSYSNASKRPTIVPKSRKALRDTRRTRPIRSMQWAKPPPCADHLRAGPEFRRYTRIANIERKVEEKRAFQEQMTKMQQPQPVVAGPSSRPPGPPCDAGPSNDAQRNVQEFMHPPGWHWEQPYAQ
jgi:hypothetical protein